jgi:cell division cycle protein 37
MKKFGMLRKYDDSQEYLLQHPELTCEETANYLVIWCINLEVEEVCSVCILVDSVTHLIRFHETEVRL